MFQLCKFGKQGKKVAKPVYWFKVQIQQTKKAAVQEGEKRSLVFQVHTELQKYKI